MPPSPGPPPPSPPIPPSPPLPSTPPPPPMSPPPFSPPPSSPSPSSPLPYCPPPSCPPPSLPPPSCPPPSHPPLLPSYPPPAHPPPLPSTLITYMQGLNTIIVPISENKNCSQIFNLSHVIKVVGYGWSCETDTSGNFVIDNTIRIGESYLLYTGQSFQILSQAQFSHSIMSQNENRINTITKSISFSEDCNSLFDKKMLNNFEGGGRLLVEGIGWVCDYIDNIQGFVPNYMIEPGEYYIVKNNIYQYHNISFRHA